MGAVERGSLRFQSQGGQFLYFQKADAGSAQRLAVFDVVR